MDLIRNDVKIDKTAVFSVGTSYVITKLSFVCGFHNIKLLDSKGKRLVSVMWQCETVPPYKTKLKFWYRRKTTRICLVIKSAYLTLQYVNVNIANRHLPQYPLYKSVHTISRHFVL